MKILGGTVWAAGKQGRHALCIFRNEQLAGYRQPDLHNFTKEQVRFHDGSLGSDYVVFLGNYPGDWHPELHNF